MLLFSTSMPERPPSPLMVSNQLASLPRYDNVPLSWVPPSRSFAFCGLTDRLWNCSVASPPLIAVRLVGMAESHCWQSARSAPVTPRPAQTPELSVNVPPVRNTPPSLPMKAISGLLGAYAKTCWSGCNQSGGDWASSVMSVKVTPPSVDRMTARPFEGELGTSSP